MGPLKPPHPAQIWILVLDVPVSAYPMVMVTPLSPGWEIVFRLACLERRDNAFQELFAQIMERRDPSFQRVRPWGNQGDRKNDGWSPERRILFQCYAPSTLDAARLEDKLVEDYEGAIDYWEDYFDKWVFVHNDIRGLAPSISKTMAELDSRSDDVDCSAWGIPQLRGRVRPASMTLIVGQS